MSKAAFKLGWPECDNFPVIDTSSCLDKDFDDWCACPLAVYYEEQEDVRGKYLNVMV